MQAMHARASPCFTSWITQPMPSIAPASDGVGGDIAAWTDPDGDEGLASNGYYL